MTPATVLLLVNCCRFPSLQVEGGKGDEADKHFKIIHFVHDPQLGCLTPKEPCRSWQGFFGVDKEFEISNHDLIRDIVEIIEIDNSMHFF
jgi:hypothetical protein